LATMEILEGIRQYLVVHKIDNISKIVRSFQL